MRRPFVIWAYSFDGDSGGIIALHLLCQRLNELGERALIWDAGRPVMRAWSDWRKAPRLARYWLGRARRAFRADPFRNPRARSRDLPGAIVVYPEIVEGDPLGAGRAVRWLLHRPGFHRGTALFGANDLFFFYQEAFDDPAINPDRENRLTLTWFIETYQQRNFGARSGSAYLLRKGKGRAITHDLTNSICVDDLSHEERAAVFNRVDRFYSYDLYSMFGMYAALCGAVPIVVPDPALTREQWTPNAEDTFGIAYGEDDIGWALATRDKLIERLGAVRAEQDAMLRRFVAKCRAAFAGPAPAPGLDIAPPRG